MSFWHGLNHKGDGRRIPDSLWEAMQSFIPPGKLQPLRCQWQALDVTGLCKRSSAHRCVQEWVKAGVFEQFWMAGLMLYDELEGIDWTWLAMDGAMTKAPLGGGKNRAQSHRPRQNRHQTQPAYRRPGHPFGGRDRRSQPQRSRAGAGNPGEYLNPPESTRAVVMCVDEKSQIQALDRSQPVLPMRPGQAERSAHDYYRHGTTSLFAALDVATGKVIGRCQKQHRHQEFLRFLDQIDRTVPAELEIHLVLDNYATHKTPKVAAWFQRSVLVFTFISLRLAAPG